MSTPANLPGVEDFSVEIDAMVVVCSVTVGIRTRPPSKSN